MEEEVYRKRISALFKVVQTRKFLKADNMPCQIEEGLYLGSVGAANNKDGLKSLNVTHILTVAHLITPDYPNDFVYKVIEVADREDVNLSQYFEECFAFIEEARVAGGSVLVHCLAGRSRSVTVVIAFLMYKNGMSFSEAMKHVKTKRHVSPNFGFMSQLRLYERSLKDARTKNGVTEKCSTSL